MQALYTLSVRCYTLLIRIGSLFLPKAKKWIAGRTNWKVQLAPVSSNSLPVMWFHFASLGEFEQGRPLMEQLKKERKCYLIITFFSPSGYEVRKHYGTADLVLYLPPDYPANAKVFIDLIQPTAAFFIKYEFWFNYLAALKEKQIPTYLISGIFRPQQHFFKWYGAWFRKRLTSFSHFFVQNQASLELLQSIGYQNASLSGDTRFDRVIEIAEQKKQFSYLSSFAKNSKVMIIGSNWPSDDELLLPFINKEAKGYKFVIAPHNVNPAQLNTLDEKLKLSTIRYSAITQQTDLSRIQVMIIDSVGFLSHLYQYGHIAYIGGGFGANVHNILEAATYGLPTIFGPNYHKFEECKALVFRKGAFSIRNGATLLVIFNQLQEQEFYTKASLAATTYVKEQSGGTAIILKALNSQLNWS
jgi:3-deoxy-D-manno-octulosonic-acid transferase